MENHSEQESSSFKEKSRQEKRSQLFDDGLQTISNGIGYLLHGESEEKEKPKSKLYYPLNIEQHHLLLIMVCILAVVLYFALRKETPTEVKNKERVDMEVEQPQMSIDDPSTWTVTEPIPVNVNNLPKKLITQINILYPDAKPTSFRWFRTVKGWNALDDVDKAKVKFSLEGYWLETEERDFPIEKIPEYLKARLKMSYPDYTLVSCERETISSGHYYELVLKRNRPDKINEEFVVYLNEKASNYANLYEGSSY